MPRPVVLSLILAVLVLAPPVLGQAPVATVTGSDGGPIPQSVAPGADLVFFGDKSVGDLDWQLIEPPLDVLSVSKDGRDGAICIVPRSITAANPGVTLKFVHIATFKTPSKPSYRFFNVVVESKPSPKPVMDDPPVVVPPPAPAGKLNLAPIISAALQSVPGDPVIVATERSNLADYYRLTAGVAAKFPDATSLLNATGKQAKTNLGPRYSAWFPLLKAVADALRDAATAGKITTTADVAAAFLELSEALGTPTR